MPLKITIIGCGNVGNALATILLNRSSRAIHLNVMEPGDHQTGRLMELSHIAGLFPKHTFSLNNLEEFAHADFVFHTAGRCMQANESRLDVAEGNIKLTQDIFDQVIFLKEPHVIVLTNPVDVITYFIWKQTKLPREKVIGTGTLLDSARFSAILNKYKIVEKTTPAWVVGEHGDSMVLLYSLQKELAKIDSDTKKAITYETVFAAKEIKKFQDHTSTGVASVAVYVMDYLLEPQSNQVLFPISCVIDTELQEKLNLDKEIAISWFFDLKNEAKSNYSFSITEDEWTKLRESAQVLATQIMNCEKSV